VWALDAAPRHCKAQLLEEEEEDEEEWEGEDPGGGEGGGRRRRKSQGYCEVEGRNLACLVHFFSLPPEGGRVYQPAIISCLHCMKIHTPIPY
jgi:hypothetical protein